MNLYQPTITGSLLVSGSITATGGIAMSGSIASASYASNASTASYWSGSIVNAASASYWSGSIVNAASSSFAATASSADAFTVRNTLTAQTLIVQTITRNITNAH